MTHLPQIPGRFDVEAALVSNARQLTLRLIRQQIAVGAALPELIECDFPGYVPRSRIFENVEAAAAENGASVACRGRFTKTAQQPPQTVHGLFVSWTTPESVRHDFYAENFDRPVHLVDAGDSIGVELFIHAENDSASASYVGSIFGFSRVVTWKGGTALYSLSGQDLALVRTTLGGLDALMRRDSTLQELSTRSTRSRVPLVPQEDAELLAAVTLVQRRLAVMLAANS